VAVVRPRRNAGTYITDRHGVMSLKPLIFEITAVGGKNTNTVGTINIVII
jgi:hypothetical protein